MARIPPLADDQLGPLSEHFAERYDDTIGFTPNSLKTMARRPEIVVALRAHITAIWPTDTMPASTFTSCLSDWSMRTAGRPPRSTPM